MKLKNKLFSAVLFTISCIPLSYAETMNNIVSFSTEVEKEVKYELLEVSLFIQHEDKELKSATKEVNTKINKALEIIRDAKVIEIKENSRSTNVRYNSKNKQDGWIAYGKLVLESQDYDLLSKVLTQLDGLLAIETVRPSVSSATLLNVENEMIQDALNQFKNKAQLIQSSLNAKNYKIVELNITTPINQNQYSPRMYQTAKFSKSSESIDLNPSKSKTALKANINARIELILE